MTARRPTLAEDVAAAAKLAAVLAALRGTVADGRASVTEAARRLHMSVRGLRGYVATNRAAIDAVAAEERWAIIPGRPKKN